MGRGKAGQEAPIVSEVRDWQRHQYDPGYYLGGRLPPYMTRPGNPRRLGGTLLFTGASTLVIAILFAPSITDDSSPTGWLAFGVPAVVALLQLAAGMRYWRTGERPDGPPRHNHPSHHRGGRRH